MASSTKSREKIYAFAFGVVFVIKRSGHLFLVDDMTDEESGGSDLQIASADGRIRPKDVYRFDGTAYVRSDLFQ